MKKYEIRTTDNQTICFEIDDPHPTFKSCFAFGINKGGSTLLFNLLTAICQQYHRIPFISVADILFMEGRNIRDIEPTTVASLYTQEGYCFGGFREFPLPWIETFLPGRKNIVLLRDPRDILVSLYYSEIYSHCIPEKNTENVEKIKRSRLRAQNLDINEFVIKRKDKFKTKLHSYQEIDKFDTVKIFRYEDVILSKKKWIQEICDFLELPLNDNQIQNILDQYDIIPTIENKEKHIRRVIPGDHLDKLKPETIKQLDEHFKDFLVNYNYKF